MSKQPPAAEKHLELLGDELALVEQPKKPPGSDPYNQVEAGSPAPDDGSSKALSPAGMRRLSEEIKSSRTWAPPKKDGADARLAALCSDLERLLTVITLATEEIAQKIPGSRSRLSDAARHIENALDCLTSWPDDSPL